MAGDGGGLVIDTDLAFVHPLLGEALAYYRSKAKGRVPRRTDLDPAGMLAFLPNVILFDVVPADGDGPDRYVYRLMGTSIAAYYGEHTGRDVDEVLPPEALARTRRALDAALQRDAPIRAVARVVDPRKSWLIGEALVAPLSQRGTATDMVFAVMFFWSEDSPPGHSAARARRPRT